VKVAIASDHAGLELKQTLAEYAADVLAVQIVDMGTLSSESCDYPEYAVRVATAIVSGQADLGILICGTGIGMSITANKIPGISAALCGDCYSARMAREHNNANVLCMGGRVIGVELAQEITRIFLTAEPIMDVDRYLRRRAQIATIEQGSRGEDR